MGLLDRAKPIEESTEYIKLLLYGFPGVGKTYFSGHAPNPVFIDHERSTEVFRHVPDLRSIPVFTPSSYKEVVDFCKEVVKTKTYDTIVIDTVSRMQMFQLSQYMKQETAGKNRSEFMPLWGDYRMSTNVIDELFVFLQTAPIHVILTAHAAEDINQETGTVTRIRPDLTPALNKALIGLINCVAYLEVVTNFKGESTRKLTVNPLNHIIAKNRLNIQEPTISNPNFKEIFLT